MRRLRFQTLLATGAVSMLGGCGYVDKAIEYAQVTPEISEAEVSGYLDAHPDLPTVDQDALKRRQITKGVSRSTIELLCKNQLRKAHAELWITKPGSRYPYDTRQLFMYFPNWSDQLECLVIRGHYWAPP